MLESNAAALARSLMAAHGLSGWHLAFDHAKRRAGITIFPSRTISLSREFVTTMDEDQVRDLVLHEIAHALAGAGHRHDATWKQICRKIGGTALASLPRGTAAPATAPLWIGTCPAGHNLGRYRRPERVCSCRECTPHFSQAHVIIWRNRKTGQILRPHGQKYR